MLSARQKLLENFDENVQERLRIAKADTEVRLDSMERLLMRFTRAMLDGHARFDDSDHGFTLHRLPDDLKPLSPMRESGWGEDSLGDASAADIPLGRYELPRRSDDAHISRFHHPLAQALLRLRVDSLNTTDEYLLAAGTAGTDVLDAEVTEKLLSLPGTAHALPRAASLPEQTPLLPDTGPTQSGLDFGAAHIPLPEALRKSLEQQKATILNHIEQRNLSLFSEESEKLDTWADDLKIALEQEIRELDRRIKDTRTRSKGAATLAEKLAAQKEQRDLEAQRDRKRRELFTRQDEIQIRRDRLIAELEHELAQRTSIRTVLCCEWGLR